jgi:DNA-binding MarR family transcriptional regulator
MELQRGSLGTLVDRFLRAMHRHDAGRTLPILHAAKLTTPQVAALEFIRETKTISAVAIHLGLSRPATSQLVDKLVRGGLVRRKEGATDRRQRHVILSAEGAALVDRLATARSARFAASLAALPTPVAARFHSVLEEVVGALIETTRPAAVSRTLRSRR